MKKKLVKPKDIEAIADAAQKDEDVSRYFNGEYQAKQRVNVDFPLSLLKLIDEDCRAVGITRQSWIKIACDERLHEIRANRIKPKAS